MIDESSEVELRRVSNWFLLDFLDFPTAWEIQKRSGSVLNHHSQCSSRPQWAMLCDCGAMEKRYEWLRNNQQHIPNKLPAKE